MSKKDASEPGEAPAPGTGQPSQPVAHTGAGAGTALDAMLRTRQMRPKRDAQADPATPASPAAPAPAPGSDTAAGPVSE